MYLSHELIKHIKRNSCLYHFDDINDTIHVIVDYRAVFDTHFLTNLPFGQPVLCFWLLFFFFGCPPFKDQLPITTQRRLVKMSLFCKMCVKWVWQSNATPALCPWFYQIITYIRVNMRCARTAANQCMCCRGSVRTCFSGQPQQDL